MRVVPRDGVDPAEELREVHRLLKPLAVGVHILAQEGDLFVAGLDKLPALLHHPVRMAAFLPAPDIGDNAVGTEVVAAQHHRDPGPGLPVPAGGDALQDLSPLAAPEKDPLGVRQAGVEQLGQPVDHMGAEDDVHEGIALFKALGHVLLLGHAAAHGDNGARVAALDVF